MKLSSRIYPEDISGESHHQYKEVYLYLLQRRPQSKLSRFLGVLGQESSQSVMSTSFLQTLCLLSFSSLIVTSSSLHQEQEEIINWPKAVDDFDQDLINLVRNKRDLDDDEETPSTTTTVSSIKATNVTAKNFTIDWNEVEKNWKATLPEEEVGKKWADMEKNLKNGVRSLLRTIFPQIVSMSSDAKVSGNCSAGILKWIISLRHLKGWAIKSKFLLTFGITIQSRSFLSCMLFFLNAHLLVTLSSK